MSAAVGRATMRRSSANAPQRVGASGIVLKAFGVDFIGLVWIAQDVSSESHGSFLAAFELGAVSDFITSRLPTGSWHDKM
jgi:hypothetical protein